MLASSCELAHENKKNRRKDKEKTYLGEVSNGVRKTLEAVYKENYMPLIRRTNSIWNVRKLSYFNYNFFFFSFLKKKKKNLMHIL